MIDAEYAVIGGMLIDPVLITEIDDLVPDDFTLESLRLIYREMVDMAVSREIIDIVTVSERMDRKYKTSEIQLMGQAIKSCVSTSNVKSYAKIVRDESQKRRAMQIAGLLLEAVPVDGLDAVDTAIKDLMSLTMTRKNHEVSMGQMMKRAVEIIEEADGKKGGVIGVPSGLTDLDKVLGGFHDSDLYVIGARPAIGKTAVLLNFANAAGVAAGVISAEQPAEQMGLRLIAIDGKVCSHKMRNGDLEEPDFARVALTVRNLHQKEIYMYDKSGPTIMEVIRQARKWKMQYDIKILYIDYVQRLKWTDLKIARHEQVGNVVMCLKELARDLNIPIVALAQVNRDVEKRTDKRPNIGDLANSSEIEKEADCVMLLYRDEAYNDKTMDKGVIEIDVAKNRHGPTGWKKFIWQERFMRVENYLPDGSY
jgi:replicative DNA helicase